MRGFYNSYFSKQRLFSVLGLGELIVFHSSVKSSYRYLLPKLRTKNFRRVKAPINYLILNFRWKTYLYLFLSFTYALYAFFFLPPASTYSPKMAVYFDPYIFPNKTELVRSVPYFAKMKVLQSAVGVYF